MQEDCQRKGHGKQLMDYLLLVKGITANKISLYKPSRSMLRFMERHYGFNKRLDESVEVFTYFDILGTAGDGDHKYDLYQKHLKFLEDKKKTKKYDDFPLFPLNKSNENTLKNSARKILDFGPTKSLMGMKKEEKKIDPLASFAFSKKKQIKSIFVKESLDELMKPLIQEQMGHDPDDLSR